MSASEAWTEARVEAPTDVRDVLTLAPLRARYRVEAGRLQLEWRGGRASEWCGMLKPELVAAR